MPRLYLIRHAKPAAAWGEDPDPGLDAIGRTQAMECSKRLGATTTPMPVFSSPLRRCRETATPLSELWGNEVQILPAVAEIPSPPLDPAARRAWLTEAMLGTWMQLHDAAPAGSTDYRRWRRNLLDSLIAMPRDCVIYTHFIAINVAVGAASDREDVVCFRPNHASVTVLSSDAARLRLIELGAEADTSVLTGR